MELKTRAIKELADRIEKCEQVEVTDHEPGRAGSAFTMSQIKYWCGSPACIMGHNTILRGRAYKDASDLQFADDLGITEWQAEELCSPQHDYADYFSDPGEIGFITKAHAVAVLRHLANTGEVDWMKHAADDSAA